jgi:hypothetical protein
MITINQIRQWYNGTFIIIINDMPEKDLCEIRGLIEKPSNLLIERSYLLRNSTEYCGDQD